MGKHQVGLNIIDTIFQTIFKFLEQSTREVQGEGLEIILPSNVFNIWTGREILIGFKKSGETDTLTEASNQIDEKYKRGEIQNEQHFSNALDKFDI